MSMRAMEFSGKSVDEAIFIGLQQMEIAIDEVDIEILQNETKGVFGIGAKPAVVRLTEKPAESLLQEAQLLTSSPASPSDYPRREQRPRDSRPPRPQQPREQRERPQQPREQREPQERREAREPSERNDQREPRPQQPLEVRESRGQRENRLAREAAGQNASARPRQQRESTQRENTQRENTQRENTQRENTQRENTQRENTQRENTQRENTQRENTQRENAQRESMPYENMPEAPRIEYSAELAKTDSAAIFLSGLLKNMGVEANVLAARQENAVRLRVDSPSMGVLIGHRGETLDAMQYLTSLAINRNHKDESYTRVTLDTEDYRDKREETLKRLGRKLAAQVKASGKPHTLEPMNPYERRVLHASLQNNPFVTTHSEGEEPNRHVVIVPKK